METVGIWPRVIRVIQIACGQVRIQCGFWGITRGKALEAEKGAYIGALTFEEVRSAHADL